MVKGKLISVDENMISNSYDMNKLIKKISIRYNFDKCHIIHFKKPLHVDNNMMDNYYIVDLNNTYSFLDIKCYEYDIMFNAYSEIKEYLDKGINVVAINYIQSFLVYDIYQQLNNIYSKNTEHKFNINNLLFIYAMMSNISSIQEFLTKIQINPTIIQKIVRCISINRIDCSCMLIPNAEVKNILFYKLSVYINRFLNPTLSVYNMKESKKIDKQDNASDNINKLNHNNNNDVLEVVIL